MALFFHSYERKAWIDPIQSPDTGKTDSGYRMETTVNPVFRPDIGKINSSPETIIFPVEKYHRACTYNMRVAGK